LREAFTRFQEAEARRLNTSAVYDAKRRKVTSDCEVVKVVSALMTFKMRVDVAERNMVYPEARVNSIF
jgi:hypothetical protein